jgi:3-hydroxyacyl-CoA dehydrogenase
MKYLVLLLLLSSCASYQFTMNRRGIAYIDCATHLMDEGFKQEMIDALCSKALEQ